MSSEALPSLAAAPHPAVAAIRACPFDLVARAELAIEGCTRLTNPARGGQPYSYAEFHTEPPVALHAPWDYGDSTGRLLEALTLARTMTSSAPDARDEALAQLLRAHQREDGLIALPPDPWTHTAPVVELEWTPRAALLAWTTRYLALDDIDAVQRAARLVHALSRNAVWEGDTCWYPGSMLPDGGWKDRQPPIGRIADVLPGAQIVFPLARFALRTSNEEAGQLAGGLIRFLIERSGAFEPSGKFTEKTGRYLHSNTGFILGVLTYGLMMSRDDLVDWARGAFDYVREWGTEFGFFPHRLAGPDRWRGDICATQDMIEIGLLLGQHRDPSYFAEAERFGRNHLMETQILDFDWVEQRVDAPFCQEVWCANHPAEGVSVDDICARAVGAFAGWSRPNDAFDPTNPRLMQRSSGAGVRALYDLWRYAVTRPEDAVMVNLHFSRDTRWATVRSFAPQIGGVEVMMKARGVLAVRVPPEVTNPDVRVNRLRQRHEIIRHGYAWVESLQGGDIVTVTWPLESRLQTYNLNNCTYVATWLGDTVLHIEPPGLLAPIYRRHGEIPPARPRTAAGPVKEIDTL